MTGTAEVPQFSGNLVRAEMQGDFKNIIHQDLSPETNTSLKEQELSSSLCIINFTYTKLFVEIKV